MLTSPTLDSNVINRLAIIIDRDDNGIKSIEKRFSESLNPVISKMKNNKWIQNTYKDSYRLDQQIETLL